jgi:hypothetical protein
MVIYDGPPSEQMICKLEWSALCTSVFSISQLFCFLFFCFFVFFFVFYHLKMFVKLSELPINVNFSSFVLFLVIVVGINYSYLEQ